MEALDYLMAGHFNEAIDAYRTTLFSTPDDLGAASGMANALMKVGRYDEAIPLKLRLHEADKAEVPDSPGQNLCIAVAYWCLEDRTRAIELAHGPCAAILNGSVSMAPDHAGGATFGLILHYMALTAGDDANRDYALRYLKKLNAKYNKRPTMFRYPKETVKQLLGEMSFADALEGASVNVLASKPGTRDLAAAYRSAKENRSIKLAIGQALFHDGVICRANGDEAGCKARMQEVFALGYQTDSLCWYLARHEVGG